MSTGGDEISLEDIDKIIETDDPEFAASLSEIAAVGVDSSVEIESSVLDDDGLIGDSDEASASRFFERFPFLKTWQKNLQEWRQKAITFVRARRAGLKILFWQVVHLLRTWPKEFLRYLWARLRAAAQGAFSLIQAFRALPRFKQATLLFFATLVFAFVIFLNLNLRGIWIPPWAPPAVTNWGQVADASFEYDREMGTELFLRAFPQEEHGFLFRKVVVNLKRSSARNPMGAFEFYVLLDSKDAAVEAQGRHQELLHVLQRSLEELTYEELESRMGKALVKDVVRRNLNEVLTQGWVLEVLIKTFILKP